MELRTYAEILWRRKWIVIMTVLAAALVLVVGLSRLTPTYTVATKIRLATAMTGSTDYVDYDILYTDRLMNTAVELASSDTLLLDVQRALGLAVPPTVRVEIIAGSELLQIIVSDRDPQQAVAIANTLAGMLVEQSEMLFDGHRTPLGAVSSLTVVEPATIPDRPSGPNKLVLLAAGLFMSVVAGGVLALIVENVDTRLHTVEQIQAITPMPIVAEIPYTRKLSRQAVSAAPIAIKQAFRRLSAMLFPVAARSSKRRNGRHGSGLKSLLVVSATPQEGRSTVVAHLAVAAARSGRSVVVVDADFHHPILHDLFDVSNNVGLTNVLTDDLMLDMALHESGIADGVYVLPAGAVWDDASDLLDTAAIHTVIDQLTKHFDLVLIDSPALMDYADSAVLLPAVDEVLVLGRLGFTRREQLVRVCDYLEQASVTAKGLVLNCAPDDARRPRRPKTRQSEPPDWGASADDDSVSDETQESRPPGLPVGQPARRRVRVGPVSRIDLRIGAYALMMGALIGLLCLFFPLPWQFVALAGIGSLFAILKRPELGVLGILLAASTLFTREVLPPFGVASVNILDMAFFALGFLILIRWLAERQFRFVRTPLDLPLLALLLAAVVSSVPPLLMSSLQIWEVYQEVVVILYYLVFFLVTQLVREKRQLRLLIEGFFVLASATGAIMLVQYVAGDSIRLLLGRVETTITQGIRYEGVMRILPPGQSLVLTASVILATLLIVDRVRLRWLVYWVLTTIGVILTFNRSFWIGMLLAFGVLAFVLKGPETLRLAKVGVVIFVVAIPALIVASLQVDSRIANLVTASAQRLVTVVAQDFTADSTFQWRYPEYEYAAAKVLEQPLLGVGMGSYYRPLDTRLDSEHFDGRRYLHNGHLYVLVKAGLVGYLCLVWVSVLFVGRGLRLWPSIADPVQQAVVLGMVMAYISVLVSAIAVPAFMEFFWAPVLGMMMGTNEVIYRLNTGAQRG